ncbi:hypothetical protein MPSEU_000402400 [Mayamaea pseudoterrestris]|nr:hypothetical protein MPSEU_000402400 [Mayamaea pseudoterrestris]
MSLFTEACSHRQEQTAAPSLRRKCPHSVLGVPKQAPLPEVKRAFLQLALMHHPDRAETKSSERFIEVRQAFEEIVSNSNSNGNNNNSTTTPNGWSREHIQDWWKSQHHDAATTTDFVNFDMTDETRHEVIQVYRTMAAGGRDKGGYWDMARQLAERESANDGEPPPTRLLETSETTTRRRRRNR